LAHDGISMKKNEHHLASALEQLAGAVEAYAEDVTRGNPGAGASWRHEYGLRLALESARRALAHHHVARGASNRAPAEVLLNLRER